MRLIGNEALGRPMDLRIDEGALREFFATLRTRQSSLDADEAASLTVTAGSLPEGSKPLVVERSSFRRLAPHPQPTRIAAVDGGSVVLHDAGTAILSARRAGFVVYHGEKLVARAVGPVNVSLLTEANALSELRDACAEAAMGEFSTPHAAPQLAEAHDALRGLEEWRAARDAMQFLEAGDVLLLDGALEAGPTKPWGILATLLDSARRRGIHVAAVSKSSRLGVDGRFPLTYAASRLASSWGVRGPWALPVFAREELMPEARGDVLVASFASEAEDVYRVDVSRTSEPAGFRGSGAGTPDGDGPFHSAIDALAKVLPHCRDAVYLGYPYPLARVHNDVAFSPDLVLECTFALRERAARLGIDALDFEALFRDRHLLLDVNR